MLVIFAITAPHTLSSCHFQSIKLVKLLFQGRYHWGGPVGAPLGRASGGMTPLFNFRTKKGPTPVSVSNTRDIAFYGYSEIIRTRNFTILPCMVQFLDNLCWLFIFSNCVRETDHFTLDLLKRSDT